MHYDMVLFLRSLVAAELKVSEGLSSLGLQPDFTLNTPYCLDLDPDCI